MKQQREKMNGFKLAMISIVILFLVAIPVIISVAGKTANWLTQQGMLG